jgi:hypothetical protein
MADTDSDSSAADPVDYQNEDGWADIEEDVETSTFVSLFDGKTFTDLNDLLRYCQVAHGFDFWKVRKTLGVPPAHMLPNGCVSSLSIKLTRTLAQIWTI